MNDEVLVTIVCTCFNKAKWIRQALDSAIEQTTSFPFDILIVDDASTDDSVSVIKSFQQEHPDLVRVVVHDENEGISATWNEACSLVRGKYIARIDGDDYWTSKTKLEEQVKILEESEDSQWCCTDFDIIDIDDNLVSKNALQSGFIDTINTYEHMLAVKGLTNSSTWLVSTELMLEANSSLHNNEADDTFSIQLELFKRTRLSRIPQSLCTMRMNVGSDSRPTSAEGAKKRFEGLKNQQLEYLDKYPDVDYALIARYLIEQDAKKDMMIYETVQHAEGLNEHAKRQRERIEQLEQQLNEKQGVVRKLASLPVRAVRAARNRR